MLLDEGAIALPTKGGCDGEVDNDAHDFRWQTPDRREERALVIDVALHVVPVDAKGSEDDFELADLSV